MYNKKKDNKKNNRVKDNKKFCGKKQKVTYKYNLNPKGTSTLSVIEVVSKTDKAMKLKVKCYNNIDGQLKETEIWVPKKCGKQVATNKYEVWNGIIITFLNAKYANIEKEYLKDHYMKFDIDAYHSHQKVLEEKRIRLENYIGDNHETFLEQYSEGLDKWIQDIYNADTLFFLKCISKASEKEDHKLSYLSKRVIDGISEKLGIKLKRITKNTDLNSFTIVNGFMNRECLLSYILTHYLKNWGSIQKLYVLDKDGYTFHYRRSKEEVSDVEKRIIKFAKYIESELINERQNSDTCNIVSSITLPESLPFYAS